MDSLTSLTNRTPLSDDQFLAILSDTKQQTIDEVRLLLNKPSDRLSLLLASLLGEFISLEMTIANKKGNTSINANIVKLGEILNLIKRTVDTAQSHPEVTFYGLEETRTLLHTLLNKNENKSDLPNTLNLYTKGLIDPEIFLRYLRVYSQLAGDACKQAIGKKTLDKIT